MITSKDLFGAKRRGHAGKRRSRFFDLVNVVSDPERDVVADQMSARATDLISHYDWRERDAISIEADRYRNCYKRAAVFGCPDCHTEYYVRDLCRSRICERCGEIYRRQLKSQVLPIIKDLLAQKRRGYVLSLVTLTVSSRRFGDALPDRQAIKRLYQESSKFFRLFYGKYRARESRSGKVVESRRLKKDRKPGQDGRVFIGAGWLAVIEVGRDNNNAHCHALIYGPIRQWFKLRSAWEKITGDSRGIDIRRIKSTAQAVDYILKYVTKPPVTSSYSRIADYAIMIKGTRRLRSGGIFYNRFKLRKAERSNRECLICSGYLRMVGMSGLNELEDSQVDYFAAGKDPDLLKDRRRMKYSHLLPEGAIPI